MTTRRWPRTGVSLFVGVLSLLLVFGGSGCSPGPPKPPPEAEPPAQYRDGETRCGYIVMDLSGAPLPGMAAVVTREPNAFDAPVARGSLTDPEGKGEVRFPSEERLYLRAWDPELRSFPNNFYEVVPAPATTLDGVELTLVPGARLAATLQDTTGAPLSDVRVEMMMSHPTRGPWWPATGTTDASGRLAFDAVPAGEYDLRFDSPVGGVSRGGVRLVPGGAVDLGALRLEQR